MIRSLFSLVSLLLCNSFWKAVDIYEATDESKLQWLHRKRDVVTHPLKLLRRKVLSHVWHERDFMEEKMLLFMWNSCSGVSTVPSSLQTQCITQLKMKWEKQAAVKKEQGVFQYFFALILVVLSLTPFQDFECFLFSVIVCLEKQVWVLLVFPLRDPKFKRRRTRSKTKKQEKTKKFWNFSFSCIESFDKFYTSLLTFEGQPCYFVITSLLLDIFNQIPWLGLFNGHPVCLRQLSSPASLGTGFKVWFWIQRIGIVRNEEG